MKIVCFEKDQKKPNTKMRECKGETFLVNQLSRAAKDKKPSSRIFILALIRKRFPTNGHYCHLATVIGKIHKPRWQIKVRA